jgi:hypothetical protein
LRRNIFIVIVIGLFLLANLTRWGFRSRVAQPRFAAEGAAHYRYTSLVARGEPVPSLDVKAQWPEGLHVFRETSIGMEYFYGILYRLFPGAGPDLARFLRFCVPFIFSALSAALWNRRSSGILTAILFAVALPLVARSSGFDLIRENLTFPLIIVHVYFFIKACTGGWVGTAFTGACTGGLGEAALSETRAGGVRGDATLPETRSGGQRDAVLSAVFLSLGLASWQGTQFYLIPLLVFLVVRRVIGAVTAEERRTVRWVLLAVVIAGVLVPFLRAGGFLLSIPVALSAAWLVADLSDRRAPGDSGVRGMPRVRVGIRLGAALIGFTCILVPGIIFKEHFVSYAHFFKLVLYKLRYVYKPSDPRMLPFDARAFWVGPFHSPDPRHLFVFALPLFLLLPNPLARLVRRAREGDFPALFTGVFVLIFFLLSLLMQRLLPLFAVFAVIAAGGSTIDFFTKWKGRTVPGFPLIAAVCMTGIFLLQDFAWEGSSDIWRRASRRLGIPYRRSFVVFPVEGDPEGEMLDWIRNNTDPDDVILSLHYLSPQVLTYTGRSTNLNDFFESPRLRNKARRLLTLLYGSEERLLEFCREQQSDYLLLSIAVGCDPTRDSPLYQAGLMDMPPGCAAYRFLFEPTRLVGFNLVFENEMYRIFRVGEPPVRRWWPRSPLFYERDLLWRYEGDIASFYNTVMHIYALTARGKSLIRAGRGGEAVRPLGEALRVYYFYPAWRLLAGLYRREKRWEDLETLAEFGYRSDPNRPEVCLELARIRIERGTTEGVDGLIERCTRLPLSERQRGQLETLRRTFQNLRGE